MAALALLFGGTLASLLLVVALPIDEVQAEALFTGAELALGFGAMALLGSGAVRASFAGAARGRDVALAVALGVATFALSWAFVAALAALADVESEPAVLTAVDWLAIVALAPLLEEWFCRGATWYALLPFTRAGERIAATAVLFGMLHCLTDGLWGFPHRFAAGLVFGWLRQRSGSLWPGIVAHVVHNALVLIAESVG